MRHPEFALRNSLIILQKYKSQSAVGSADGNNQSNPELCAPNLDTQTQLMANGERPALSIPPQLGGQDCSQD
jgi:hypothetical protein